MKVFKFLILLLLLSSCNLPKYYFKDDTVTTGVNFSEGKWLLNRIESSKNTEDRLTAIATEFFTKKTSYRFNTVYSAKILDLDHFCFDYRYSINHLLVCQ